MDDRDFQSFVMGWSQPFVIPFRSRASEYSSWVLYSPILVLNMLELTEISLIAKYSLQNTHSRNLGIIYFLLWL